MGGGVGQGNKENGKTVAGDGFLKMDRTFVTRHKNGTSLQFGVEMNKEIGQLRGAA